MAPTKLLPLVTLAVCLTLAVAMEPDIVVRSSHSDCNGLEQLANASLPWDGVTADVADWQCIVLLLCMGAFALFISLIHRVTRTHIYYDAHLLDTFFDAGGDVNFAMVATSLFSKWAWTSVFVAPVLGVYRYGLVGCFWFSACLAIQLFLFAIVATEIRIKAPGAKTYLQVIKSRFGTGAHVILMIFALFLNLLIAGMVMMEAARIIQSVTNGVNQEVICIVIAITVGVFTVVSGVGGHMYVCYFASVLIMAITTMLLADVFWNPLEREMQPFGTRESIFDRVQCAIPNDHNEMDPLTEKYAALTFGSKDGMLEGIAMVFGAFGVVFVDQSFWQAGVSAKPNHGLGGFLTAGLSWFALPFCFSYAIGMAYWAFVVENGPSHLVKEEGAIDGSLTTIVIQHMWGTAGSFLVFVIVEAAAVTTISAQVLSASSIVVYDIYQTYIAPFKSLPLPENKEVSMHMRRAIRTEEYLEYDKRSVVLKHVVVICLTFLLLAIAAILLAIDIDAYWLFFFAAILMNSCVLPVTLSVVWHRITGVGVWVGVLVGCLCGIVAWLIWAADYEGGLKKFKENTGRPYPIIAGEVIALVMGGIICISLSICCGGCDASVHEEEVWEKTRNIDNPILPWSVKYAPDVKGQGLNRGRPQFYTVRRIFQGAEVIAYLLGVLLAVLFILVWPACMLTVNFGDKDVFNVWTWAVMILAIVITSYLTLVPLLWEIVQSCTQAYYNRQWSRNDNQRLEEEPSEPDHKPYQREPTPPPVQPPPDNNSESDFQSTLGRGGDLERWKTFIHLD